MAQFLCIAPGCGKPSVLACPICHQLRLPASPFCSQACFNRYFLEHCKIHTEHLKAIERRLRVDDLKSAATAMFKSLQFIKAAQLYADAWDTRQDDPVFPSNISACYYELGNYNQSAHFAGIALNILQHQNDEKLLFKNLVRLTKSYVYIGNAPKAKALLPAFADRRDEASLEVIHYVNRLDDQCLTFQNPEMFRTHFVKVASLPKYRPCRITSVSEYYALGQCDANSILLSGNMSGEKTGGTRLKHCSRNQLQNQNYLLSGLGDARHLYGTMLDLHIQAQELSDAKLSQLKIRVVVNDNKAAALAKVLVMLAALYNLSAFGLEQLGRDVEATKAVCVVIYLFLGNVIPLFAAVEIQRIIKSLHENGIPEHLQFVQLSPTDWAQVKEALRLWMEPCRFTAQQGVECLISKADLKPLSTDEIFEHFGIDVMKALDATLVGDGTSLQSRAKMEERKKTILSSIENFARELQFFSERKYLLPPKVVIDSDSELKAVICAADGKKGIKALDRFIFRNWMFNQTMVDPKWYEVTKYDLELIWDVSFVIQKLFAPTFVPKPDVASSPYDCLYLYFHRLSKAVEFFGASECLTVTGFVVDCYDLCTNLRSNALLRSIKEKIKASGNGGKDLLESLNLDQKRNSGDKSHHFTRLYLNNLPDYYSLLYMFTEAVLLLRCGNSSFIETEMLLNSDIWESYDHYIYNSSLFISSKEAEKLINVSLRCGGDLSKSCCSHWGIASDSFSPDLSCKDEVLEWCCRVLLASCFPPSRDPTCPSGECFAPGAVAFFRCLYLLITVGYPKHWFVTLLKSMLENKLVGAATAPMSSPMHYVPRTQKSKINLSSLLLELNTLTPMYLPLLGISCPSAALPLLSSICEYSLRFDSMLDFHDQDGCSSGFPFSNTLGLLFVQPSPYDDSLDNCLRERLLEGGFYRDGSCYQLVSTFVWDSDQHKVTFHLPEKEYERMRCELSGRWMVVLLRTDSWTRISCCQKFSDVQLVERFVS